MTDVLQQLGIAQSLLEKGPISLVAALALAGCLWLGRALLREKDKRAELLEEFAVRMEVVMRSMVALEEEKRLRRRRGAGTAEHQSLPKAGGDNEAA